VQKEFICTLHSSISCSFRGYREAMCSLNVKSPFASCPHRIAAVELAAQLEESPVNVAQQAQPEKNADVMEVEMKECF